MQPCRGGWEEGAERAGQRPLVLGEPAPGDPGDAVPGDEERAVAVPVLLERRARPVGGESVELGDEPVVGPEAVDLLRVRMEVDRGVDPRAREAVCVEEGEEAELELVFRDVATDVAASQEGAEGGGPLARRVARDQGIEGGGTAEAADLRLRRRPFEVVGADDRGEVEEGPGGGGDGDSVCGW